VNTGARQFKTIPM